MAEKPEAPGEDPGAAARYQSEITSDILELYRKLQGDSPGGVPPGALTACIQLQWLHELRVLREEFQGFLRWTYLGQGQVRTALERMESATADNTLVVLRATEKELDRVRGELAAALAELQQREAPPAATEEAASVPRAKAKASKP